MTSHNPRRNQLVAVPSSNILEKASASERVFWSSISDAVESNTEDRTEIRTFIRNIRESFSKITEDEHPAEEVQRAHDIVVEDLRSTIVKLLSSGYKSSSVVSTLRSRSNHELTTEHKYHSSRRSHMSEAVLQGARDIIGLRRVQLERELHELSTRQAQLLHSQEHGYSGAGEHSKSVVVPGFPGPKGHQEDPGAKGFDGDQGIQGSDGVPGTRGPTGEDGLQGLCGDVEPTGRDGRDGIPEEQGDTSPPRFPDGEGCRGLDDADKVPDTGFSKRHVPPGFDGRQGDTGFSKSHDPPGFDRRQGDTRFSESDGPPGFDGLQGDPGLFGIPGSQDCTRVQGRSDFQGDTCEQGFPGSDAATGESSCPDVRVFDGEDGRSGRTGETGKNECPGPQGSAGEQGFPGPDAATGDTGRLGVPVVRESDGEDGRPGRTDEAGVTGEKGSPYPQGPAGSPGDKDSAWLEGDPHINGIPGDSIARVVETIGFRGAPGMQGFRGNPGTVGSDSAPDVQILRGLAGAVSHTDPPGPICLDGDLGSTGFLRPNGLAVGIESKGSPDASEATGTRGRQGPTGRIGLPDTVGDKERPGLCGATERSGLVGPYGVNGWADGRRRNRPFRAQRFPGKKGVCGITRCVGLRGMTGRQCDTRARGLPGANSHRDLTGLAGPPDYVYARKRWRQVQFDPGIFWSLWRSDYLLTLEHWHGG